MRILITGAGGQLGQELPRSLEGDEVFAFDHNGLDITDLDRTRSIVRELNPEVVIHSAAYTNVDGCETDPERARLVNALGTRNVALACHDCGAAMAYISTDYVFDGTKGSPYLESDETNPISVYGESKLEGERQVRAVLSKHYIVRTSWLYSNSGKNFVKTILSLARRGGLLGVVDEIGSPTYARDLAGGLATLIRRQDFGVFHLPNEGACSRFEWMRAIVEMAGVDTEVRPVTADEFLADHPLPARRPHNSTLKNHRAAGVLGIQLRPWRTALAEMIEREARL
ncbi:MAG: dTDP-4-dehydrorhamnose reductase [Chloroflexi bacterium]|nr:dTDP-4-dehydrorhamnose reductase [Chloroflexota bacterium]